MYNLQDHFIWGIFDFWFFFGEILRVKKKANGNPKPPHTTLGLKIEILTT
jgi:hypothetical protein